MVRTLLYLFGGVLLGLAIHLVVILTLPALASNNRRGSRIAAIGQLNKTVLLDPVAAGAPNPLRLDPDLAYAICRLDLAKRSGRTQRHPARSPSGRSRSSIRAGTVIYSTTNRDGIGQIARSRHLRPGQTRLLAEQKIDIAAGLLIVEAQTDDIFVVVRLAPPQPAMRDRYEAQLARLGCRNIKT